MAPTRRSRRLEQKVTDAQEEASATTAVIIQATTKAAATTTVTKKATSTRTKKAPVLKPTPVTAAVRRESAAQSRAKKSTTRKTLTIAAAAGTPKEARATKTTTVKAKGKARTTEVSEKGGGDIDTGVTDVDADGEVTLVGDDGVPDMAPKAKGRGKGKARKVKDDITTDEKKGKPKAKRTKKAKDNTAAAAVAGGNGLKAKTERTKKIKKENDSTTAPTGRKKRKVDLVNDGIDGDGDERSGVISSSQSGPALKKQKITKGKKSGAAAAAAASPVEPAEPIIVNKSDPYSAFPTELWQEVMSYLSLSQIANASTVSKAWLEGTRSLQIWRNVCTKAALGNPKKKYPTHMSLVCTQSYWICEQCLTMNNGKGSDIPLPVEIAELANERRMLCRPCRYRYYKKHPEETKLRKDVTNHYGEHIYEHDVRVTKTEACTVFYLRDEDLRSLDCLQKRNPHYRNAAPMRLYLEQDVQERSLEVHGGWIGIRAVGREVAKTRREAAKKRAQGLQTHVVLPLVGEKKNKDKAMSSTKGKMPMTEAVAMAAHEKSVQLWVETLRKPGRKTQLVNAIAEAEGLIAAGEPPLVINSTKPALKWIDTLRNVFHGSLATREAIKKIIQDFEAGVYDTPQASSSTEAAIEAGTGATGAAGAGSSTVSPLAMGATSSAA
ncbi:hypothetical protein BG015_004658 [Linnemannia schmuckeri]|uniref:F-box domain-containing protein n=1 Tax=Linnemannia schmuckeri TaxID=64567 RepID=A0A9P5R925_9FUNG|nr:hypothetical protein BG015_004658 [Linnemannia schmuckeri]